MSQKPNIILLLNDHQAYYGHGEMAGGPKILRPSFERLAAEGVEFIRAYTACPLCGPARRSILTGLFPHNHGEIVNDTNHKYDRITYLEKLAEDGYENYYYGKWHAGRKTAHYFNCEGFSYPSYNNPYTKSEYNEYLEKNNLPPFEVQIQRSFWEPGRKYYFLPDVKEGALYKPKSYWCAEHATGIMTTPKETHEAFFLASLACNKLKDIVKSGSKKPFHLRVDFWGPHQPYFATQEFLDMYNPNDIPEYPSFRDDLKSKPEVYKFDTNYPLSKMRKILYPNPLPWSEWQKVIALNYAQQTLIDEAGGLILETLEDLELAENTIVVWSADHGDALACHGGHFDKAFYMPEEMVRIPMAIRYPNMIKPGQKSGKLVSNIDIAPTFLDVAGTSFGDSIDGESLLPVCLGNDNNWREELMVQTHGHLIPHLGRLVVTDRYKYVWNEGDMDELYDLKEDPFEMKNLSKIEKYSKVLLDMKNRLKIVRKKSGDFIERGMIKGRRLRIK
ncbi:MAG: sulfatase-like hydrolase/transferase [Candidatus Helarchaeota archaeon]|nr:sulfatase-like hydrolase/transferase [Candidatus Helarchaeota archaeon]